MQNLLPTNSLFKKEPTKTKNTNSAHVETKKTKRVLSNAEIWAEKWTKPQLEAHAEANLSNWEKSKATKLQLATALVDAGFLQPILPKSRLECLVKQLKHDLGEPTELVAHPIVTIKNARLVEDSCLAVDDSGQVVGAVSDGVLVKLSETNVQVALGLRLSLDSFAILRPRATGAKLNLLDDGDSDNENVDMET